MYSKLSFGLHGLVALMSLPVLWLWDRITGFCPEVVENRNLSGYICVVTGGNTGVGRETALQLALRGATVVLACRDPKKGTTAATTLKLAVDSTDSEKFPFANQSSVIFLPLDLSCLFSVKAFSVLFLEKFSHLDILVNNGGMNLKGTNRNGLQELFMVNYLSHYLLYRLLEPALAASPSDSTTLGAEYVPKEARVVNLSSVMHHEGNSEFERSAFSKYSANEPHSYYSDSKLYLNYLTMEINRFNRSENRDPSKRYVTAVSVNPGAVRSDIWRHVPWPFSYPYDIFMRFYYLNVQQGAAPSLYATMISLKSSSPLLPYVVPYRVHGNLLAYEMMGPFGGARWGSPSLPERADEKSVELFKFSENLINSLVEAERDEKFLNCKYYLK